MCEHHSLLKVDSVCDYYSFILFAVAQIASVEIWCFYPQKCYNNFSSVNRMLVYEFVNNGNLEQWLHGAMRQRGVFTWENRMKVVTGTAKA